ncbi:MAG: transketolase, partial [Erysipelotrichaceae bacterium]|nr:transketolase [Erysipelotrichaceae bacterium]
MELEKISNSARKSIVRMVHNSKSGHPGGSLSSIDILTALYFNVMRIDQNNLHDTQRDKLVLSKGHASPALYAILAEKGFIPKEELMTFRLINTRLQGHPNMND